VSVYVDAARHRLGRMLMCHMVASTTAELLAMADAIGVDRRHLQDAGTYREHFDVCKAKRKLAIAAGAHELQQGELGRLLAAKKHDHLFIAQPRPNVVVGGSGGVVALPIIVTAALAYWLQRQGLG
jgi:hypothetical protein